MTVSSQQSFIEYNGDGVTKTFTIPFYFLLGSDISIVLAYANGSEISLSYGIDYTVVGDGSPSGGAATLNVAPASGALVSIYRNPPVTQETAYYENGKFPAKSHEKALDKLTMIIQSLIYKMNIFNSKAIKAPELGDWVTPNIADRKNKVFTWDDNGYPAATLPPSGSATDVMIELSKPGAATKIGNSAVVVRDMVTLRAAAWVKSGQFYDLQSFVSLDNGGRGYWLAVNTSTVTPNGIDIVQSDAVPSVSFVFQPINGTVDIRQVGAIGGADVTAILNRVYQMSSANTIVLSAISIGEVFLCSDKIVAGKTTFGINKPVFDFNSCVAGVDAWAYENDSAPLKSNVVYKGFEVRNSKFRGFSGGGDNVRFEDLIIRDSQEQGIGWNGNRWKVIDCQIFGTKNSYDIVIGGVSNDVEVSGCHIEGAVTLGGIEPAYSCRNVSIHDNFIRNQPYGVLVWPRTPNGTDKLCRNVNIHSNIFSELSKGGVWIRCDETDFTARSVNVANNIFQSNNLDSAFAIRVGGWGEVLIQNNLITDYNTTGCVGVVLDTFGGHATGSVTIMGNTFETIQQCVSFTTNIDGVTIRNNVARSVTYDFVVYPVGNSMANCKVIDNEVSAGRDFLRNFSYMSARHVRGNSFKLPLASQSQLTGATVIAGDKFLLNPPIPGTSEGFVCTTGGVVGTSAVLKNLAAIAS